MKKIILLALIICLVWVGDVAGQSCGDTLSTNTTLPDDVGDCTGAYGFTLSGAITFDGAGYTLSGDWYDASVYYGVGMSATTQTVENLTVNYFQSTPINNPQGIIDTCNFSYTMAGISTADILTLTDSSISHIGGYAWAHAITLNDVSTVTGNTLEWNHYNIEVVNGAGASVISNNKVFFGHRGLYSSNSSATWSGNKVYFVNNGLGHYRYDQDNDSWPSMSNITTNEFIHCSMAEMMDNDELVAEPRVIQVNVNHEYEFTLKMLTDEDTTNTTTGTATHTITPTPPVTDNFSFVQGTGIVSGDFTPTRIGLHTLQLVLGDGSNSSVRNIVYHVTADGTLDSYPTKDDVYYLRQTASYTTYGGAYQPRLGYGFGSFDRSSFKTTAPTCDEGECSQFDHLPDPIDDYCELTSCGHETWTYLDEKPDYPFGRINNVNYSGQYKNISADGVSSNIFTWRMGGYEVEDIFTSPATSAFFAKDTDTTFNCFIDYPSQWYSLTLHVLADSDGGGGLGPYLNSCASDPGTLTITKSYFPLIKSISNDRIVLMEATQDSSTLRWTLVFNNPTDDNITYTVTIADTNYHQSSVEFTYSGLDTVLQITTNAESTTTITPIEGKILLWDNSASSYTEYDTWAAVLAAKTLDDDDIADGKNNTFAEEITPNCPMLGGGTSGHPIIMKNFEATSFSNNIATGFYNYIEFHNCITTSATTGGFTFAVGIGCKVLNSICIDATTTGVAVMSGADVEVKNNIIKDAGSNDIYVFGAGSTITGGYNCISDSAPNEVSGGVYTNTDTSDIYNVSDPGFVSVTNYRLAPNSVCKFAGVDVGLDSDMVGVKWADVPSIGPFEFDRTGSHRKRVLNCIRN